MGIFSKIKSGLKRTKDALGYKLNKLFTGGVLDDDFYDELEAILLSADVGTSTTEEILEDLRDCIDDKHIRNTADVKEELKQILTDILTLNEPDKYNYPLIILLMGVNGVGKTTAIGKLAYKFKQEGRSVTVVAGDTFRAAASDQLTIWAERAGVRIIKHTEGADPGAVVYDAIASAKTKHTDVLLIDTAGRLHNKVGLMNELGKISKIIDREYPSAMRLNYIVLDATTGQNGLVQAQVFSDTLDVDGIILTKLDGTAKGGIVFSICKDLDVPVVYAGIGESIDDLIEFDAQDFIETLMD